MQRNLYTIEIKERALSAARDRGSRTLQTVADEHNVSLSTLKNWLKRTRAEAVVPHGAQQPLRSAPRPRFTAGERLAFLGDSHGLTGELLSAWCRTKGLFERELVQWREGFCAAAPATRLALDPTQSVPFKALNAQHVALGKERARKERALAEAAALLVLQKKFQSLWADAA